MKNFLELLDTDMSVSVVVTIEPVTANGDPIAWITINGQTFYHSRLSSAVSVTADIPLLNPIDIEIGMSGKIYNENAETAVIIRSVCIDGFEIVPNYTQCARYQNDRDFDSPTSYLGFNGVWRLSTSEPFYRWQHKITGQGWLLEPMLQKNNTF